MKEPRHPISFRFDPEFMRLLDRLKAKMMAKSYTTVIIQAVRDLAKKEGVE